jgi:putative tricarboxylic transport membrane protein
MKYCGIRALLGAAALVSVTMTGPVMAEYPVDTVRLLTHSSPGGGMDVFLREIGKHLGPIMGVHFVVESVTGSGGAAAMAAVANGPKDGSVFYGSTPTHIITSLLSQTPVTYEDLDPVVNLFNDPQTVYVLADSPYQTLGDVVEAAKANPSSIVAAVSTPGSLDRQVMEEFQSLTGTSMIVLTHDGGGDAILSVLNGTAQVGVSEIAELRGQMEANKVRILATYTDDRVPGIGDVPTAKEQGYDLVVSKFRGIVGAKDLPPEVITAWEEGVAKLMEDPEFRKWYEAEGLENAYMTQAEARASRDEFVTTLKAFFEKFGIN